MTKLIVGGTFDRAGGKASFMIAQLWMGLGDGWECINGGSIETLKLFSPKGIKVLIWMPNISNEEDKIVDTLKKINPSILLIQSKRSVDKKYSDFDVIGRLLKSHSALGIKIEITDGKYRFKLLDPLGNDWGYSRSLFDLSYPIQKRVDRLLSLTRVGSIRKDSLNLQGKVPEDFLEVVKEYGARFSKFVMAVNPNRFLGNASTRCAKGFPAIRMQSCILVTRRNVDKETLSEEDFVAVSNVLDNAVHYVGPNKPSVDTPIQIKLFELYSNVNYIIHGHAYIANAPFTESKIPCGYLEEYEEIYKLFPGRGMTNFSVNLSGHGCLILANDLEYLRNKMDKLYGLNTVTALK